MDLPISRFWEIYYFDDRGEIIDHTKENHAELTFRSEADAEKKWNELAEEGHSIEMWVMG